MHELVFTTRTTLPTRTPDVLDRNQTLLSSAEGYVYKTVDGADLGAYVFRPPSPPPTHRLAGCLLLLQQFMGQWPRQPVRPPRPLPDQPRHGVCPRRLPRQQPPPGCHPPRCHGGRPLGDPLGPGKCSGTPLRSLPLRRNRRQRRSPCHPFRSHPEEVPRLPRRESQHPLLPNLLILFSPVTDTSPRGGVPADRFASPGDARDANLLLHVRKRLPPTLIFHGTADRVVPFASSKRFVSRNWWRRNHCHLRSFEGKGHGFFNFNVDVRNYEITLTEIDAFLVEYGFLPPNPEDDGVPRLS